MTTEPWQKSMFANPDCPFCDGYGRVKLYRPGTNPEHYPVQTCFCTKTDTKENKT